MVARLRTNVLTTHDSARVKKCCVGDGIRMRSTEFEGQTCSIARALEIVGEWWTLLIIREAMFGTERFTDFQLRLGVAKNVLSERLTKLVDAGIMTRTAVSGRGNPQHYQLTRAGRELLPVVVALMQWGDRWIYGRPAAPLRLMDAESGTEVDAVRVLSKAGEVLSLDNIEIRPGPGANESIRRRFGGKS